MPQIRGIAVNWRFGPKGYPEPATDIELLSDSIYTILKTLPGERVYNPNFGCNLKRLLFTNMSRQARVRAATETRSAIQNNEDRVIVDDILIDNNAEANQIALTVVWRPLGSSGPQQRTTAAFDGGG